MINHSFIQKIENKELQEWCFELSAFQYAMKDGSWKYEPEVSVSAEIYDDAFLIALDFKRKLNCEIKVLETPDDKEDSFTLSYFKVHVRHKKEIHFKTKKI
jgi:hypothetical protein